jgi:hypothetical protein
MPTESDTLKLGWYMREGLGAFVADTAADLPSDVALSALGWVQDPPALYMYTSTGWTPLASLEGAELPVVGNHNLFSTSHPDVDSADTPTDGEILTYDGASSLWNAAPPVPDATETTPGKVELASEDEVQAGTAGVLVSTVARLKDELDRRISGRRAPRGVGRSRTAARRADTPGGAADGRCSQPDTRRGGRIRGPALLARVRHAQLVPTDTD